MTGNTKINSYAILKCYQQVRNGIRLGADDLLDARSYNERLDMTAKVFVVDGWGNAKLRKHNDDMNHLLIFRLDWLYESFS